MKRKPLKMWYAGVGSRETPDDVLQEMEDLAVEFEKMNLILRSGGAKGADSAFEKGAGDKKEIIIPSDNFKGRSTTQSGVYELSQYWYENLEPTAKNFHPAWEKCSPFVKRLHTRNVAVVLGVHEDQPVKFVICWTKDGKATGGTGQAMRIAWNKGIPVINLKPEPGNASYRKRSIISKVNRILDTRVHMWAAV